MTFHKGMATRYTLADDAVALVLETAVRHVFETSLECKIETIETLSRSDLQQMEGSTLTSDYVRLYGDFTGLICLQMSRKLIQRIASDSLGFDAFKEETFAGDQILRDAAGEVVNMLAGTFKNMLSRVKMNCRLSPPERFNEESELVQQSLAAENRWCLNCQIGGELTQAILLSQRA